MQRRMDLSLVALRAILGVVFMAHGAQKLFGWFGGRGFAAEIAEMRELGLEPALFMALMATLSEFGGGLLVLLGLLTPLGALAIASVMVVAIATVNGQNGFFAINVGYEYNLVLITICAVLILMGAGAYSLDRVLAADGRLLPRLARVVLRQNDAPEARQRPTSAEDL